MSTSRRTYHHGDLPAALVRAAEEILEKQGVGALTLREVARKAGVSHGAPYRHFQSLDHLLAAVAEQGFRQLGEALKGRAPAEMGEAYVSFALGHPALFRLMFSGALPGTGETARGVYRSLVEALSGQREIAQPERAAAAAWALVHGLSTLLLDGHLEELATRTGRKELVRAVLGAVRFAAGPQRSA
jgi:AcrR family transcriptional regulator